MKKNKLNLFPILTAIIMAISLNINLALADIDPCLATSSTMDKVACDSFIFNDTIRYLTGEYSAVIKNAAGCDSTISLSLEIINTNNSPSLTATSSCGEGYDTLSFALDRLNSPSILMFNWYDNYNVLVGEGLQFVTPKISTTTTYYGSITYKGCESQKTPIDAIVKKRPYAPYISDEIPKCEGNTFVYNALVPSRINCRNCTDPNDYLWMNSENKIVSTDHTFITPILSNSEYYTVIASLDGCQSDPTEIYAQVINVYKPELINIPSTCSGNSIELSVGNTSNTRFEGCRGCNESFDYTWYNANGDSIGTNSSFTTPVLMNSTKYSVKASDRGCYSDAYVFDVLVSPNKPVITQSPVSIYACLEPNQSILGGFKVKAIGENLQYGIGIYDNESLIENQDVESDTINVSISAAKYGYSFVYYVFNGCGIDTSDIAYFHINNKVDVSVIKTGNTLTANASGLTYQWYDCYNESKIDGATDQSFVPSKSGNYAVSIVDELTCDKNNFSECYAIDLIATALDTAPTVAYSVFPNPVNDFVNVTMSSTINGTVSITDINGNVILSKVVNGSEFRIPTSDLFSGVYILKLSSSTLSITKQIVVVK